jgi:hypothetical protein
MDDDRAAPSVGQPPCIPTAHGCATLKVDAEVLRQLNKAKRELRQAHRAHKKKRAVETNKAWANGQAHTAYHALEGAR